MSKGKWDEFVETEEPKTSKWDSYEVKKKDSPDSTVTAPPVAGGSPNGLQGQPDGAGSVPSNPTIDRAQQSIERRRQLLEQGTSDIIVNNPVYQVESNREKYLKAVQGHPLHKLVDYVEQNVKNLYEGAKEAMVNPTYPYAGSANIMANWIKQAEEGKPNLIGEMGKFTKESTLGTIESGKKVIEEVAKAQNVKQTPKKSLETLANIATGIPKTVMEGAIAVGSITPAGMTFIAAIDGLKIAGVSQEKINTAMSMASSAGQELGILTEESADWEKNLFTIGDLVFLGGGMHLTHKTMKMVKDGVPVAEMPKESQTEIKDAYGNVTKNDMKAAMTHPENIELAKQEKKILDLQDDHIKVPEMAKPIIMEELQKAEAEKQQIEQAEVAKTLDEANQKATEQINGEIKSELDKAIEMPISETSKEAIKTMSDNLKVGDTVEMEVNQKLLETDLPKVDKPEIVQEPKEETHRTTIENKFREEFKAKGVSDEQIDGALALMNARAKSAVSRGEVKTADEWYDKIADVKSGEFQSETPKQYQLPDGEKVMGVNQPEVVNGFYSPLEKIISESKSDKLPSKQWLDKFARGEEAKWTGLADWLKEQNRPVSKAEIQQYLKDNRIEVVEVVKGKKDVGRSEKEKADYADIIHKRANGTATKAETDRYFKYLEQDTAHRDDSKFSQYQTEGEKSNYKEVLITMPFNDARAKEYLKGKSDKSQPIFKSPHFDEPNILAHLRMNTRTSADGVKTLFIEEIQSDFAQTGKKQGFRLTEKEAGEAWKVADEKYADFMKRMKNKYGNEWADELTKAEVEEETKLLDTRENTKGGAIPSAPFVTETPQWVKLGLKTAIQHAIKEGAERISWTTGEQQNARYDLSKQVDRVNVEPLVDNINGKLVPNGKYVVSVSPKSEGNEFDYAPLQEMGTYTADKLPDVIGKELADRVVKEGGGNYEGIDLKVGGTGMIGFYGSPTEGKLGIVGQVAESLFGKGSVKTTEINLGKVNPKNIDEFNQWLKDKGFDYAWGDVAEMVKDRAKLWTEYLDETVKEKTEAQHSIDITPKIKAEVEKGLPLFQKDKTGKPKGAVETLADGRKIIHALDAPDFSTMVHEIAHVFESDLSKAEQKTVTDFGGSEAFARGFERYLRDGKSPTPELKTLFEKFKDWLTEIYKSLKGSAIEKKLSPEIKGIFDKLLSETKGGEEIKREEVKSEKYVEKPLSEINVDEKRFQNRTELDENQLEQIKKNWNENELDPVVIWKDANGKDYLLAGHHRLEAAKQLGKNAIDARYFKGTEAEAIKYAKEKSNANRTMEQPFDRAKRVREKREAGEDTSEILALEGKNERHTERLSYLNPKGKAIENIKLFVKSGDKKTQKVVEGIADWVGEVRKFISELTDAHENEMYDFLYKNEGKSDKDPSKITTMAEFVDLMNRRVNGLEEFNPNEILNFEHKVGRGINESEVHKEVRAKERERDAKKKEIKNVQRTETDKAKRDKKISELSKDLIRLEQEVGDLTKKQKAAAEGDKKQYDIFSQINANVKDGNITTEQVRTFEERPAGEVEKSEPVVKDIEGAAESKVKADNERAVSESEKLLGEKEVTKTEKSQKRLDDATTALAKKIGGSLQSGGLNAIPEFVEYVKAFIDHYGNKIEDFLKKFRKDFPESKHTDKELKAAFDKENVKKTVTTFRAYEGEFREEVKSELEKLGLTRETQSFAEAESKAKEIIDRYGVDTAYEAVLKGDITGAPAAEIFNAKIESLEKKMLENPDAIPELAAEQAQVINKLSGEALQKGQFNAQLGHIYEKSDLGYNFTKKVEEWKEKFGGTIPPEIEAKFKEVDAKLKEVEKKLHEAEAREENLKTEVKSKKIKDASRKIADAILRGRISRPSVFLSASPASLVWDGALKVVAESVKVTGDMAQAVADGLQHVKESEWYKNASDKIKEAAEKSFTDWFNGKSDRMAGIVARLHKDILELQRKISEGDFSKAEKKEPISSPEITSLKAEKLRLRAIYDKEFYKEELRNRTTAQKWKDHIWDLWGLTRVLRATGEFSFVGLQGIINTIAHPIQATQAISNALKFMGSEKRTEQWLNSIKSQEWYPELKESKLNLTEPHAELTAREELFYSDWANMIWNTIGTPLKYIRPKAYEIFKNASPFKAIERAAVGFLDTQRVLRFLDGKQMLEKQGLSFKDNPQAWKDMSDVINTFTGRASIGGAERLQKQLTRIFFSPRLWASQIKTATPYAFYHFGKMRAGAKPYRPSVAQKMAISDFSKFVGLTTSMVALAYLHYENDDDPTTGVETDPTSSDFGKIKIGKTRIDPYGGRIQNIILISRLIADSIKKESGEKVPLGTPFRTPTREGLLIEMATNKLAPSASMLEKFLSSHEKKDGTRIDKYGQPYEFSEDLKENLYPIYWGTVYDLLKDDPTALDGLLTFYAFFGGGVNVYDKKDTQDQPAGSSVPASPVPASPVKAKAIPASPVPPKK